LVAPEMTSWNASRLKGFLTATGFNDIHGQYDDYGMVVLNGCGNRFHSANTWEELINKANRGVGLRYDLKDIYEYYISMSNDVSDEEERIANLYDFVSVKFLGEKLPIAYRDVLTADANHGRIYVQVREAVQKVVNTSHFMIID